MVALLWLVLMAEPDPKPAVAAHQLCQREKRLDRCPEALSAYVPYLLAAPGDSTMRFYFAELLWGEGRWAQAAGEYRRVALDESCRYAKHAAFNALLARGKLVKRAAPHRHDGKPWPLDVERQDLIDAIDFFLARYPDDPDAEAATGHAAQLYFDFDDFVHAERRALWLLVRGREVTFARSLLERIEVERKRVPEVGASLTIGKSKPIGEAQTIGESQTIGGSGLDDEEPEEEEEVP